MKKKNVKNPIIFGLIFAFVLSFSLSSFAMQSSVAYAPTSAILSEQTTLTNKVDKKNTAKTEASADTSEEATKVSLKDTSSVNASLKENSNAEAVVYDTMDLSETAELETNASTSDTSENTTSNEESAIAITDEAVSGIYGNLSSHNEVNASDLSSLTDISVEESEDIYQYCPTSIDNAVLYCSNEATPGEIKDGICINGTRVLTTTENAWDSVQVCDPTVIAGNFTYGSQSYLYLMAYLGCATYDCTANEIGFALSNDLYNWTKIGRAVAATKDGYWGVGQPSLISYNQTIYLFYTSGTASATTTYASKVTDTNFNNGILLSSPVEIKCSYDFISNADFAFSGTTLYMTCDTHPFPDGALNFVSAVQSVYEGQWDGTLEGLKSISWTRIAQVGSNTTGHERNHNGCFLRNGDGSLQSRTIYVSTSDSVGNYNENLWTYRFQTVAY